MPRSTLMFLGLLLAALLTLPLAALTVATPVFNPSGGTYNQPQTVHVTCTTDSVTIRYTETGSEPHPGSPVFPSGGLSVSSPKTLKAKAFRTGWTASATATAVYSFQAATPTFSPVAGTYHTNQTVTISCASPGVTIRYTDDGTTPNSGSTPYTAPLSITQTTTLKAKAIISGWTDSQIATATYTLQVGDPVFSPPAGTFNSNQSVTITTVTVGDTIRYTINGTNPTTSSPIYTNPISITGTTTLKARSFRGGWTDSVITTGVYVLKPVTPVISPNGGTFVEDSTHTISITCTTPTVQIRYTLDGSEPSQSNGTVYSTPFTIDRTRTIKAKAFKTAWTASETAEATVNLKAHIPSISPAAGTYIEVSGKEITLGCATTGATIRYTTNGNDPTASSIEYTAPFNITQSCTVKARAFKANWTESDISSQAYVLKAIAPTISPDPGTYTVVSGLPVTLASATTGATIRYTIDGSDPTASSSEYGTPFNITQNCTVKARAFKTNWTASDVSSQAYQLRVSTPLIDPATSLWVEAEGHQVTFSCPTPDVTIRYTTNGNDPTSGSPEAPAGGITVNQTTTVKARAFLNYWLESAVDTSVITLKAIAPVSDIPPDVYNSEQNIVLSSGTVNTTLRYTLDYSDPTTTSPIYTEPIPITQNITVKARAFRNNWATSEVSIFEYTLRPATPAFSPPAGAYDSPQQVVISSTLGAQIRYTTDGSEPGPASLLYSDPIPVAENTTIRARAYKPGWTRSELGSAFYTFNVATPIFDPPGGVFAESQQVSISCNTPDAEIRYTIDGSDPTASSSEYGTPFNITQNCTVKARAFKAGHSPSQVNMAQYTINGQIAFTAPAFTPGPGTYTNAVEVVISGNTYPTGAQIRFTLDGSEPNEASPLYADPILVSGDTTIKARAFLANWVPSEVQTATYLITGQLTPILSFIPPAGTYTQAQSVSISATGLPSGCQLHYTLDGTPPDENSPLYSEPVELPLNSQTTIRVRAFKEDWEPSATWSASYTITGAVVLNNLTFAPMPGVYTGEQYISLAAGVDPIDAVLRFTLDGSEPTSTSQTYPAIIHIPSGDSLTVKVGAFKDGWIPSQTHTAEYRTVEYASQINVQASYLFAGINGTDYRLVGLPGLVNNPVGQYMHGEHGTDWKLFHEPGEGMDLIPWTQARNFAFTPGRAYWLLSRTPVHITTTQVPAVALDNELCYSLQIHPGWNIITSPFTIAVPWEAVRQSNTTSNYTLVDKLYAYGSGTYSEADTLEAYQGFYFYNRRPNAISLRIPYWWEPEDKAPAVLPPHCEISLAASAASPPLRLGISTQASDELDDLDQFAPPTDFCEYYLSLEDGQLNQEFRNSSNQIFDFQVKAPAGESPALEITAVPDLPNAYLWDKADDSFHALAEAVTYPLLPCHGSFALVTGSADFVQNLKDSLIPGVVSIPQNRPNPFRDFTSIKAGFAGNARVWVEVFNIRGQKVAVLADDAQVMAGTHEWLLDASKLAAGLYLCRVSWDDGQMKGQQTLKMVHVK